MRFADPKSDIAFKKIFGNENRREILISFLNAVLNLPPGRKVTDVEILNPYQAPRIKGLKETALDVRAKDQRGVQYIVEMQVQKQTGFEKRVLYYSTKAYSSQIEIADTYPRLNQVIFIGICDFSIFEGADYLTRHLILNQANQRQELKDLEFNFIELTKFDRREEELKGIVEEWVYFLKNAPNLKLIPSGILDCGLQAAYETAGTHLWSQEELDVYDYWGVRSQDMPMAIDFAVKEATARVTKDVTAKVTEDLMAKVTARVTKEKEGVVFELKKRGFSMEEISSITGLSTEEIGKPWHIRL